jgi:hypothetical protein
MNNTRTTTLSLLFLFSVFFLSPMYSQVSQYVVDVKIPASSEKTALSISVELTQNTQIRQVVLHYREFGRTEFKEVDMLLSGRTAVATIPAKSVTSPYIEYYIGLQLADSKLATFPSESAETNPIKIQVKELDAKDLEARFLTPEPGETLTAEDLAVAVSLMYASDKVEISRTRIYLDGADVTNEALITDDVLLYSPKNFNKPLSIGAHSVKIELQDSLGNIYYTKQEAFNLSTASAIEEIKSSLQYTGNAQAEFRNEKLDIATTSYIRGDVHIGGTYKEFTFGGDLHVTNEEKSYLQPQNRYLATFQAADYAKVQVGDAYPQFPSLVVSGKRVRGITGSFSVGFFNLDVSYGKTDRAVEGITQDITYSDSSSAAKHPTEAIPLGGLQYRLFQPGTYARNFFAIRPSFGSGENFQFGITYMNSKDDKSSITYGMHPMENFVAGIDWLLAFDNQKIKWASQAAVSLENIDISTGDYSDADYDAFAGVGNPEKDQEEAKRDADNFKRIAKIIRHFITANEFLRPLNPQKGMPSLAYESELSLNYYNNYVRFMLFRRGIAYTSYGNNFVQNDIAGINVSDRVRLFDNKIMASVSYETKRNNTMNEASTPTTTYNALNTSVTAYPGAMYPSFTVGYGLNTRKNPVDLSMYIAANKPLLRDLDTSSILSWSLSSTQNLYTLVPSDNMIQIANESTNRYFIALNYDFYYLARQSANATLSIANKKDKTFFQRNMDNVNFSTSLTSYYSIPLQTTLTFVMSQSSAYSAIQDSVRAYLSGTQKQVFKYQTISLGARYRLMEDRLNLLATVAPSFGDFKRLLIQAGAEYQVAENHYLISQCDFIQNSGRTSDIVFSLLYRFLF